MIYTSCKTCGKKIARMPYAKKLRHVGYCWDHVPHNIKKQVTYSKKSADAKKRRKKARKRYQCQGVTLSGERCRNKNRNPGLCRIHRDQSPTYGTLEIKTQRKKRKKTNYNIYINSPQWKNKSKAIRAENNCVLCGGIAENVHHNNYRNVGNEYENDLAPLCRNCHLMFHTFYKYKKGSFVPLRKFTPAEKETGL